MKPNTLSRLNLSLFQNSGSHTVKLIKADQVGRSLSPEGGSCDSAAKGPRKSPEVRLVGTGADYCDLEIVCGCGDTTRFRCWNTTATEEKGAR